MYYWHFYRPVNNLGNNYVMAICHGTHIANWTAANFYLDAATK